MHGTGTRHPSSARVRAEHVLPIAAWPQPKGEGSGFRGQVSVIRGPPRESNCTQIPKPFEQESQRCGRRSTGASSLFASAFRAGIEKRHRYFALHGWTVSGGDRCWTHGYIAPRRGRPRITDTWPIILDRTRGAYPAPGSLSKLTVVADCLRRRWFPKEPITMAGWGRRIPWRYVVLVFLLCGLLVAAIIGARAAQRSGPRVGPKYPTI